jgi:hypothetical protein
MVYIFKYCRRGVGTKGEQNIQALGGDELIKPCKQEYSKEKA